MRPTSRSTFPTPTIPTHHTWDATLFHPQRENRHTLSAIRPPSCMVIGNVTHSKISYCASCPKHKRHILDDVMWLFKSYILSQYFVRIIWVKYFGNRFTKNNVSHLDILFSGYMNARVLMNSKKRYSNMRRGNVTSTVCNFDKLHIVTLKGSIPLCINM
jgi:hypothetical protein